MCEATRAADATADACHAFDEIGVEDVFVLFEQGDSAFFDAIARDGFEREVVVSAFFETLCDGVGESAAASENAPVVGGVVEDVFG